MSCRSPLAAFGCLIVGCIASTAQSPYMRPASGDFDPPPWMANSARVLFVREGSGSNCIIMDERGRFLGESVPGTRFSSMVSAGEHYFIAWTGGTPEALHAKLLPGRTYWVLVSSGPALWAITEAKGLTKDIPRYLSSTREMVPDSDAGQAYLDSMRAKATKAVAEGIARHHGYSATDSSDATLLPDDDRPL